MRRVEAPRGRRTTGRAVRRGLLAKFHELGLAKAEEYRELHGLRRE